MAGVDELAASPDAYNQRAYPHEQHRQRRRHPPPGVHRIKFAADQDMRLLRDPGYQGLHHIEPHIFGGK